MPLIRKGPHQPTAPNNPDMDAAIATLRAGSTQERWAAARSLAALHGAAPALGQALANEPDQRVREAIFTSLVRINTTDSVDAVLPYLRLDDANLRNGALDALKAMSGTVQPRLELLLHDADADVRVLACDLAREAPSAEATRLLSAVLDADPVMNVCIAAVETLAEVGSSDALASLARCVERFPDQAFLGFAAKAASERIGSQSPPRQG
jgi:HEAT repeat protein